MATGRLGAANLSAATNTTVYDVPDEHICSGNI
jgi:hypothetical protein